MKIYSDVLIYYQDKIFSNEMILPWESKCGKILRYEIVEIREKKWGGMKKEGGRH